MCAKEKKEKKHFPLLSREPLSFSTRQMWHSDPMTVFVEPMVGRLEAGDPTGGCLRRCIGPKTVA
ncbi:hypothetical protein GGP41_002011 [Bipolaris sorokiniana]|uniref:Uncharacterized protein n=1 Tax=Cochliobolus sativus TaxID=45130 RepID=A0A8H6E0H2_COCSA|nr:hypothetical protein GGP41_002011 [Bipolaris sorokiniana]